MHVVTVSGAAEAFTRARWTKFMARSNGSVGAFQGDHPDKATHIASSAARASSLSGFPHFLECHVRFLSILETARFILRMPTTGVWTYAQTR